jgi:MFS family permease
LRKPVLIGGGLIMFVMIGQIALLPALLPPIFGMLILGIASGAAMIPYTIIKEANPDEVKGSATGTINFLNFGISALIGPVFGGVLGRTLETTSDAFAHFRHAGLFWMAAVLLAVAMSFFLRETGHRRVAQPGPAQS